MLLQKDLAGNSVDICTGGGIAGGGRNAQFIGARVTAFGPEGIGNTLVALVLRLKFRRTGNGVGKLARF